MTLVKTSLLTAVATLVRIATAVALNKVLAVYVGPAGYALVGQFSNAVAIAGALSGGAIGNGVTKYTAQHGDDPARQRDHWRAATAYVAVCTTVASVVVLAFRRELAEHLLGSAELATAFTFLALALPLTAANGLLLAVLNGRKEVRAYVLQNLAASVLGALLAGLLAIRFGLLGALVALAVNQAVVVAVTLVLCRKYEWLEARAFFGAVDRRTLAPLLAFALMTLTSAIVGPASQVLVRDHLIARFGEAAAGQWQGVFKISEIYLTVFTSALSVYYLPRLAEIRTSRELWEEIARIYRFILPVAAVAAACMFALRSWITTALFTADFLGMVDLFGWQLFGDVLKIGSWILGFVMIGRGMARWFVATEIVFGSSWVLLTMLLTGRNGLGGATAAFACNYALYWAFMAWLIRKQFAEPAP